LQAAGRMVRFPPEDMVTTLVTFNRTLYAQLKQQEFQVGWLLLAT
jgi:SGT1 protein